VTISWRNFKTGDKVRIKDQPGWPTPPGYRFAGAEGMVIESDFDELMEEFLPHMVFVKLGKAGGQAQEYVVDAAFWFLTEYVEKI
jgi:hypothetical protein